MDKIADKIFKYTKANENKLLQHGFVLKDGKYHFSTELLNGQFRLCVDIGESVATEVIDLSTNEPYTLFLHDDVVGSFVGQVRQEYERILSDIAEHCFEKEVFKFAQTKSIISYASEKYNDELEFLWEKFPDTAVLRRKDSKKWYAALMIIQKDKLGLASKEKTEILNVSLKPEEVERLVDNEKIFRGYHMNKKHWISVCLDGALKTEDIIKYLDTSYELAGK